MALAVVIAAIDRFAIGVARLVGIARPVAVTWLIRIGAVIIAVATIGRRTRDNGAARDAANNPRADRAADAAGLSRAGGRNRDESQRAGAGDDGQKSGHGSCSSVRVSPPQRAAGAVVPGLGHWPGRGASRFRCRPRRISAPAALPLG